jgi:hypothetical protein
MSAVRLPLCLVTVCLGFFLAGPIKSQESSETIPANVSPDAADLLWGKIVAIRAAESSSTRNRDAASSIRVTDVEMESFVFFSMKDEIPANVRSIDVTVEAGTISVATELLFDSQEGSGNPIVDILLENPHSLFVKGALEGHAGRGTFALQQVRVDGFPVPIAVVEILVGRFVVPRFPQVDLDEEFPIPWGIEEIDLAEEGVTITY